MTTSSDRFTAIVPAGRRPGGPDRLAALFGVAFKAQIPVAGEAMLSRVMRTLLASPHIERIVILVQEVDALLDHDDLRWLGRQSRVQFETSGNSVSASVHRLLASGRVTWPVLLTTADHVLLTQEMIAHFQSHAAKAACDVSVAMVERKTLQAAYPDNQRTWLKFSDGWWSGANLFGLFSARALPALAFWQSVEQDRKKGLKIIAAFGPWLLLRVLLKSISLRDGLAKAGARLGLNASLVAMPMAEACIDVDKESDLALAEQILAARAHG